MGAWSYVLDFTRALIWPVVVFVIIYVFRKPLADFLERVTQIGAGPSGISASADPPQSQELRQKKSSKNNKAVKDLQPLVKRYKTQLSNTRKGLTDAQKKSQDLENQNSLLNAQVELEQIYSLIFGSQISLLAAIENNGGVSAQQPLDSFFELHKQLTSYSTVYKTFEDFVAFMSGHKLIEVDAQGFYHLTQRGQVFLNYIRSLSYPLGKPF